MPDQVFSENANDALNAIIDMALGEDIGTADVTTEALVPAQAMAQAVIVAREDGVVAGIRVVSEVFRRLDPAITIKVAVSDGARVRAGETVMTLKGRARAIMTGERTALNFLQRLSGIATQTAAYVARVRDYPVSLLDTRKTTPGLRALEKYAVECGGGQNHRMGLHDRVLIKDNHLAFWTSSAERTLAQAIRAARTRYPELQVQVEIDRPDQLADALSEEPDWILLDNMSPAAVQQCVAACAGACKIEVSGGITLETIADYAKAGPDAISVGALTHSVRAMDYSLDIAFK